MKNCSMAFLILSSFSLFCTACSVKSEETVRAEDTNPEFVFSDLVYTKYEDKKVSVQLAADKMERYKSNQTIYAQNVTFDAYDENNEIKTSGSCGYMYANPDAEIYKLFDDIKISSKDYKADFSANSLEYNGNTEQLVGSKTDTVKIEKDDTIIYGTGFSASSLSDSFSFAGTVTGEIQTEEGGSE